jgi:riboflavin synthase
VFTGLIADLGRVEAVERDRDGATLRIETALARELGEGDSIAVNGVCLTVTSVVVTGPAARARGGAREGEGVRAKGEGEGDGVRAKGEGEGEGARAKAEGALEGARGKSADAPPGGFIAQAMNETLQRSTLGALAVGESVNLELALRADGRLGGHVVQGHVDGVATIAEIREEGFSRVIALDCDAALLPCVVEKGSVALAGVSLTVSALREHGFEVSLIPETLQRTTLGDAAVGGAVNIEVDILAKHVQRLLAAAAPASRP